MTFRNAITLAALASLMALPMASNAQSRGRHDDNSRGQSQQHKSDRSDKWPVQNHGQQQRNDNRDWNRQQNDRAAEQRRIEQQRLNDQRYLQEQQRVQQLQREAEARRRQQEYQRNQQWDRNQGYRYDSDHRANLQNEWRNIAIGSGLLGVLGLLQHDNTLFFSGAAGALYSTYRYEQDRNSTDRVARARAEYFGKSYFYRDGKRYDRRSVNRNGQSYYQFVCND